jgi:hypothetical protein
LKPWLDARRKRKNVSKICGEALSIEMNNNTWKQEKIEERIRELDREREIQETKLEQIRQENDAPTQRKIDYGNLGAAAEFIILNNIFPSTEGQWAQNARAWGVLPWELADEVKKRRGA